MLLLFWVGGPGRCGREASVGGVRRKRRSMKAPSFHLCTADHFVSVCLSRFIPAPPALHQITCRSFVLYKNFSSCDVNCK